MCNKCEPMMGKVGCGLGLLSLLLAIVSRLAHFSVLSLGPRSFAAAAALFFLLSISVNCSKSGHEQHN